MSIQATSVTLPAHWAPALINGDFSALEDERDYIEKEVAALAQAGWQVVSTDGAEPRFTWRYPLYHPGNPAQGGEVLDYIIVRSEKPAPPPMQSVKKWGA